MDDKTMAPKRTKANDWARAWRAADAARRSAETSQNALGDTQPKFWPEGSNRPYLRIMEDGGLGAVSADLAMVGIPPERIPALKAWLDEWYG